MEFRPRLMATTLSGMPHRDVEEACQLMLRNFPEAPSPPTLTRSLRMWLGGMPCLILDRQKRQVFFDLSSGRESELVEFYERYLSEDLDYFAISPESNPGFYKLVQMLREGASPELKLINITPPGPYTFGEVVKDESGNTAFYNDTMRDVVVKILIMKVRWLERKVKELLPGIRTMVCIGNGGLGAYSSAGGVGTWDIIKNAYNELIEGVEGITGIHCCANMEWPLLMETNTDAINFDAYQYGSTMSLYPGELKKFLERGGMIAWGIVPTTPGDIEGESPGSLVERLEQAIQLLVDKGIDRKMLLELSMITPSCQTITMSVELAERAFNFTREVSQRMREKYFG